MTTTTPATDDPRIPGILATLTQLASENWDARAAASGSDDSLDQIIAGINRLADVLAARQAAAIANEVRFEELVDVISAMAALDFTKRAPVGEEGDALDALGYGINILSEELTASMVSKGALETERALLARRVEERTADLSATNAELARAARLKDEFLTSMSHELRTPLNAILGLSEALQEAIYGPLTQQQAKTVQTIEQSGRHLLDLINDILDLAKIAAGEAALEIESVLLAALCQSSLQFVKQLAHDKHITVASAIDPSLTTIPADARRLKQILINLLNNAVKFTPAGGAVGLEVVGDRVGHSVQLTVWDSGIGITETDLPRLFKPFVQLDSRLARQYEGTGLGLALVARMVELHGGSISVTSQLGAGSRFTVSLPWRDLDATTERPAACAPGSSASEYRTIRRALIVEDSPTAAEQLSRYLNELAIVTVTHLRGAETVARAIQEQPDLIVLDLLLPDISGWDVLAQLKADPRTQPIPVVLVSVIDEPSRGFASGAAEYLIKPFSRADVQRAIGALAPDVHAGGYRQGTDQAEQPASAKAPPVVLLAEDNEANITIVLDYLSSKGYQVVVARNGAEAVARARELRPAIILMDIQMPVMDGLEATRHIRADGDFVEVPIIAMTALAMPGDRERCLAAGANDYLSKPVSLKRLAVLLDDYLPPQRSS
ncbi:MAG TPA: response regulator [Roseiflexaceae bacterium]